VRGLNSRAPRRESTSQTKPEPTRSWYARALALIGGARALVLYRFTYCFSIGSELNRGSSLFFGCGVVTVLRVLNHFSESCCTFNESLRTLTLHQVIVRPYIRRRWISSLPNASRPPEKRMTTKYLPFRNNFRSRLTKRVRVSASASGRIAIIIAVSSWAGVKLVQPAAAVGSAHNMQTAAGVILPVPAVGLNYGATKPESVPIERPSPDGTGNFRTDCKFSHMNYDDPIVYPGQPGAAHLHTYFGNTEANAASTGASLLASGNSTCDGGTLNRTAYWLPSIMGATGQPMAPIANMVYYKQGYQGLTRDQIVSSLPNGLELVAGDPKATADAGDKRVVHWSCSTLSWRGRQGSIPECPAGETIKAEINFPQCWDGKNLSSADHTSHMAYGVWQVGCPATHPVGIPAIAFNVQWEVPPGGTTGWRLSSDMYPGGAGGYSLHADMIMAWDPATSSTWLKNCVKDNADCHVNQISDTAALIYGSRNGDATPPPTVPSATTIPATTIPATTIPATTIPATTIPATTIPAPIAPTTVRPTTAPPATTPPTTSASSACANNRLANAGFERGLEGWDSWGGADTIVADAKSGTAAWLVDGRGQFISVTPGEQLDVSVWAKAGSTGWSAIGLEFYSATDRLDTGAASQQVSAITYEQSRLMATVPAGSVRARVWAWSANKNLTVDDWCVKAG
jgi:Domain of unknown function (DUF1996)